MYAPPRPVLSFRGHSERGEESRSGVLLVVRKPVPSDERRICSDCGGRFGPRGKVDSSVVCRPEGPDYQSPGQRPGATGQRARVRALKGRTSLSSAPFQGYKDFGRTLDPGRWPGLGSIAPSGAVIPRRRDCSRLLVSDRHGFAGERPDAVNGPRGPAVAAGTWHQGANGGVADQARHPKGQTAATPKGRRPEGGLCATKSRFCQPASLQLRRCLLIQSG